MTETQALEEWARTTRFSEPIRWGEIEDAVMARQIPALDGASLPQKMLFHVAMVVVYTFAVGVVYGGAIVGLAIVLYAVHIASPDTAEILLVITQVFFLGAVASCVAMIFAWHEVRKRAPTDLVIAAMAAVFPAVALVVLIQGDSGFGRTEVIAALASVTGLVTFVLLLTASRGTRPGMGLSLNMESRENRYCAARNQVMTILRERGLVAIPYDQRMKMVKMPMGSWHEFDTPNNEGTGRSTSG